MRNSHTIEAVEVIIVRELDRLSMFGDHNHPLLDCVDRTLDRGFVTNEEFSKKYPETQWILKYDHYLRDLRAAVHTESVRQATPEVFQAYETH